MSRNDRIFYGLIIVLMLLLTACGNGKEEGKDTINQTVPDKENASSTPVPIKSDPITIKMYTNISASLLELQKDLIQKKFPNVTVNTIAPSTTEKTLPNQLAASGNLPDLIAYSIGSLWDFQDTGLLSDLSPLMKEAKFDSNRFLPNVLSSVQAYSPKGEIMFLPYNLSANVLYYSKDTFDRFGVSYPKDGMTWDEVNALAKLMTRMDNGVQYRGFLFNNQHLVWKNQLLQPLVDPKTFKTLVNNTGWKKWITTMGDFYRIPGNDSGGTFGANTTIAMFVGPPTVLTNLANRNIEKEGLFNWDIVTLPTFSGVASTGTQMISPFYAIPPTSKYQREVFQIIDYMLSEEVQVIMARNGIIPIIKSETAIKEFGKELKALEGKNLKALFQDTIGSAFATTPYDDIAKTILFSDVLPAYIKGDSDINTLFRAAEEKINLQIADTVKK